MKIRGIIMDMDGTIVDSPLNFESIREDLGLAPGAPILESIDVMPLSIQAKLLNRLELHEENAAKQSRVFAGVPDFFFNLKQKNIKTAIFTRNSRRIAELTLQMHSIQPDLLVAREDAPPKPRPDGILHILNSWNLSKDQVIFLGDYLYDLQAGACAGVRTYLYSPGNLPSFADQANGVFAHYDHLWTNLERQDFSDINGLR